jgi:hypothetical protein
LRNSLSGSAFVLLQLTRVSPIPLDDTKNQGKVAILRPGQVGAGALKGSDDSAQRQLDNRMSRC